MKEIISYPPVAAIHQLMAAPERPAKKIGYQLREKRAAYGKRFCEII